MSTRKIIPEHYIRLSDFALADLLGIKLEHYHRLKHTPLISLKNEQGVVTEFYMLLNDVNDTEIVKQLKISHPNYLRFAPEEVYARYV